jgi:hypothetical protein
MMLFRMVEILFELFIWNDNEELKRTIDILSLSWNNKIIVILIISKQ